MPTFYRAQNLSAVGHSWKASHNFKVYFCLYDPNQGIPHFLKKAYLRLNDPNSSAFLFFLNFGNNFLYTYKIKPSKTRLN